MNPGFSHCVWFFNYLWQRTVKSLETESRYFIEITFITDPSFNPSIFFSSAKLSSETPFSWRQKQVRWQVSSRSISSWCISWTISILDTYVRRSRQSHLHCKQAIVRPIRYLDIELFHSRRIDFDCESYVLNENKILLVSLLVIFTFGIFIILSHTATFVASLRCDFLPGIQVFFMLF